jgi:hypothetical protein
MHFALPLALSTALSLVSLKFLPVPFLWISLLFFLAFGWIAITQVRDSIKLISINLAGISLILGICETYLFLAKMDDTTVHYRRIGQQNIPADENASRLAVDHDIFGYAPQKNTKWMAEKYYKDKLVYAAKYTIDAQGLRAIPDTSDGDVGNECIFFFGGSFSFGEGLNDNEALPYLVWLRSGGKYQVYNFAFSGYGAHQALARIQNNYLGEFIDCEPAHALFLTMTGHVPRSSGLERWDTTGPRYSLDRNGEVTFVGHFDDQKDERIGFLIRKVREQFDKSHLYKTISVYWTNLRKYSDNNVRLYLAIVQKMRKVLELRHPNLQFHVVFFDDIWDGTSKLVGEKVLSGLGATGVRVYMVRDILPDSSSEETIHKYKISKYDDHPNAMTNESLADYIIDNIVISPSHSQSRFSR